MKADFNVTSPGKNGETNPMVGENNSDHNNAHHSNNSNVVSLLEKSYAKQTQKLTGKKKNPILAKLVLNPKDRAHLARLKESAAVQKFVVLVQKKILFPMRMREYNSSVVELRRTLKPKYYEIFRDEVDLVPKQLKGRKRMVSRFLHKLNQKLDGGTELLTGGETGWIPVFRPESRFRVIWSSIFLLIIIYYMFMLPYRLCFFKTQTNETAFLEFWMDSFLIVDILFLINTGYYENGYLVMNRKRIWKRFYQQVLVWEITSLIGNAAGMLNNLNKVGKAWGNETESYFELVHCMILGKLRMASPIYHEIVDYLELSESSIQKLRVIQLLHILVFAMHILACFFFLVGSTEFTLDKRTGSTPTWTTRTSQTFTFTWPRFT